MAASRGTNAAGAGRHVAVVLAPRQPYGSGRLIHGALPIVKHKGHFGLRRGLDRGQTATRHVAGSKIEGRSSHTVPGPHSRCPFAFARSDQLEQWPTIDSRSSEGTSESFATSSGAETGKSDVGVPTVPRADAPPENGANRRATARAASAGLPGPGCAADGATALPVRTPVKHRGACPAPRRRSTHPTSRSRRRRAPSARGSCRA